MSSTNLVLISVEESVETNVTKCTWNTARSCGSAHVLVQQLANSTQQVLRKFTGKALNYFTRTFETGSVTDISYKPLLFFQLRLLRDVIL